VPTLFQLLTFRFSTTSATSKIDDGGSGGSAATLSGCHLSQGKSPPLRAGWLSFLLLLRIALCLLHFASPLSLFAFQQLQPTFSFFSFFLSLHFLLIVGCRLVSPSLGFVGAGFLLRSSPFLGVGLGGAPIPRRRPRPRQSSHSLASALPSVLPRRRPQRCSHSSVLALAVLPFLGVGLGSSPIPWRRPCPRWWSSSVHRPRLGGPPRPHLGIQHETFGPALVLRTRPSVLPWWCSSSAPCISFVGTFLAYC
jgi:hypothetical protein